MQRPESLDHLPFQQVPNLSKKVANPEKDLDTEEELVSARIACQRANIRVCKSHPVILVYGKFKIASRKVRVPEGSTQEQ